MNQDSKLLALLNLNEQVLSHLALSTSENPLELFAAVSWSHLTEPGDAFAGFVREALGGTEALALLVAGATEASWLARIQESGRAEAAEVRFGDASATLQDSLARWTQRLSLNTVLKSLDETVSMGAHLIAPQDANWPSQLSALKHAAPALLWLRGDPKALRSSELSWAVVGCRTPTSYGQEATSHMVQGLADAGVTIVSGGAFGIDAIAHHAALLCQTPTIAVMAGGVDRLYPKSNEFLLSKIISEGAVVSEVPLATAPTKWRFLQRNRIIAALAGGTVIVEAGYRSGAINTANHAAALERPVAAVPGSIFSSRSAGCHRLIAEDRAQVVESAADLLAIFPGKFLVDEPIFEFMAPLETRTFDSIGFGAPTIDQICRDAGLTLSEATQAIGALLLKGKVLQRGAGYQRA